MNVLTELRDLEEIHWVDTHTGLPSNVHVDIGALVRGTLDRVLQLSSTLQAAHILTLQQFSS